ncbi:translation elongation factor Ts [Granulicoccus phenolivorans]|uniref:translation elongation factor Ts n=1 Tax=Granulicoccus phenolivorans TaxID=266854 RepID=UPI0003F705AC|nr:translation elongation factor Ts [Granulicoccus phenolivorans]
MASFAAADVKKLRDATGAGMMDAKKALTEADGDFDKAVDILRVTGLAKAAKRAERDAGNGLVANAGNALIQLGSETDFVAKNQEFIDLADEIAKAVNDAKANGVEAAKAAKLPSGKTVEEAVADLAAVIGEKLELKDAVYYDGKTKVYLHKRASDLPPQVGVLVSYEGDNDSAIHSVALQIASMKPQFLDRDTVPADVVEHERQVAEDKSREEGKPEKALPKIVEGRVNAYFKEVCLVDQDSISEDKKSVGQQLKEAGLTVKEFARFEAGA